MKVVHVLGRTVADVVREAGLSSLRPDADADSVLSCIRALADAALGLDEVVFEGVRSQALKIVKPFGVRAATLDAAFRTARATADERKAEALWSDPEPWHELVTTAELIGELEAVFNEYLALIEGAALVLALWVLHTWTHDDSEISPILALTSPVHRCGKTTALKLLRGVVRRPIHASSISEAVIFRVIDKFKPTLLIDEMDSFLDSRNEMRGILNCGHSRDGSIVLRSESTPGGSYEPRQFSAWAPKAFALIGTLPSTLEDRSIIIPMRRRRKSEARSRFEAPTRARLRLLARKLAKWSKDQAGVLRLSQPEPIVELNDRAWDNWRDMITIAVWGGSALANRASHVAIQFSKRSGQNEGSGTRLLRDLQAVFKETGEPRIRSDDVVAFLVQLEDRPWAEWRSGSPVSTVQVAKLLRPFGITPGKWRDGEKSGLRGYELTKCRDAFDRYLTD